MWIFVFKFNQSSRCIKRDKTTGGRRRTIHRHPWSFVVERTEAQQRSHFTRHCAHTWNAHVRFRIRSKSENPTDASARSTEITRKYLDNFFFRVTTKQRVPKYIYIKRYSITIRSNNHDRGTILCVLGRVREALRELESTKYSEYSEK